MSSHILPISALVVALGIFFGYVNPTWGGSIATTKAAIKADDAALAAADNYAKQQNQLTAARDAIDPANLTALATFLPGSVDNVRITLDLNSLAARSRLAVSNIDVVTGGTNSRSSPDSAQNPVGSVDLSLSAVGTFAALQEFLVGIEKSVRLLDVHDLVVRGSDTGVYNYQMTLRLYWLH
jgi:hypothetical protein